MKFENKERYCVCGSKDTCNNPRCLFHRSVIYVMLYLSAYALAFIGFINSKRNKKLFKDFHLSSVSGIYPMMFAVGPNEESPTEQNYLVIGTGIVITYDAVNKKYYFEVIHFDGLPSVDLEYIIQNYPEKISNRFLFNLDLFK